MMYSSHILNHVSKSELSAKRRAFNWRDHEKDILIDSFFSNKCPFKISQSLYHTITKSDRDVFWQETTDKINKVSDVERTRKQVYKKWSDLKRDAKRAQLRKGWQLTRRGFFTSSLFSQRQKVIRILQTCCPDDIEVIEDTPNTSCDKGDEQTSGSNCPIKIERDKESSPGPDHSEFEEFNQYIKVEVEVESSSSDHVPKADQVHIADDVPIADQNHIADHVPIANQVYITDHVPIADRQSPATESSRTDHPNSLHRKRKASSSPTEDYSAMLLQIEQQKLELKKQKLALETEKLIIQKEQLQQMTEIKHILKDILDKKEIEIPIDPSIQALLSSATES